ncbi:MAG: monodechloroaminopyrrolnitrin synthase PrnB family protein [Candidatus Lariskella arthropodorum]
METALTYSKYVSSLDPLYFDELVSLIHDSNAQKNSSELIRILKTLAERAAIRDFNYYEKIAAIRDIGILLGSLIRLDIQPCDILPGLPDVLMKFAKDTDFPPRDTILHYTIFNPQNARIRSYTGLSDELLFIQNIRSGVFDVITAMHELVILYTISPLDEEFTLCAENILAKLTVSLYKCLALAAQVASSEVAANKLMYFYQELTIDNQKYFWVNFIQACICIFDHILWSCSIAEELPIQEQKIDLLYMFPELRQIYKRFIDMPDLITKFSHLTKGKTHLEIVQKNHKLLTHILNYLIDPKKSPIQADNDTSLDDQKSKFNSSDIFIPNHQLFFAKKHEAAMRLRNLIH